MGRSSRSKRRSDDDSASESESDENDSRDSSPDRSSHKRSKDRSRCSKSKSSCHSRIRRDRDSDNDSFGDDSEGSDRGRSKKKRSSRNITKEDIAEYMAKKAQKKAKPDAGKLIVGIVALLVVSASGLLIMELQKPFSRHLCLLDLQDQRSVWMLASLCGVVGFKLTFGFIPHSRFRDKTGNFKLPLCDDIKAMLSLYKASYYCFEGESIMEACLGASTTLEDAKVRSKVVH
ncbi:hypothetical protein CRYUN_Cryun32bG0027900 [Craigia yunnanensis]